jgi:hypothetical protein
VGDVVDWVTVNCVVVEPWPASSVIINPQSPGSTEGTTTVVFRFPLVSAVTV